MLTCRGIHPKLRGFVWVWCLAVLYPLALFAATGPEPMLASVYQAQGDVSQFWVSEKLDGVRARWDGKQLVSRTGKVFTTPAWFVENFPKQMLDGELWLGRGHYEDVVSIVNQQSPHEGWRKLKLMVFDVPMVAGGFSGRVAAMGALKTTPYLAVIGQERVATTQELMAKLAAVVQQGGEGLVLHHQDALYKSGRSQQLFKLKPFVDADAVVVAHKPGKGKYLGLMGSLVVRMDNGKTFAVGSGFTLAQRKNPPPIGSLISYRYQGFTQRGIPRFAVFVRLRGE